MMTDEERNALAKERKKILNDAYTNLCINHCEYAKDISYVGGYFRCVGHGYDSMREIEAQINKCENYVRKN